MGMQVNRVQVLGGVLLLLAVIFVWRWVDSWGLITIQVKEAPLSQVLAKMSRQAGVTILTNLDPATPVTLDVRKMPLVEALDIVAVRTEADWQAAVLGAPDKATLQAGRQLLGQSGRPEGWRIFHFPMPMMAEAVIEEVSDPRQAKWNATSEAEGNLQAYLNQATQKTGVMVAVPRDWNPAVNKQPASGEAVDSVRKLLSSAGGKTDTFFYLRSSRWNRNAPPVAQGEQPSTQWAQPTGSNQPGQRPNRGGGGGGRGQINPEYLQDRINNELAKLPAAEREAAIREANEMRQFWTEVRALPEEERRAKIEEFMSNPANQERMEAAMSRRDSKRTPEQRASRYRNYIERKQRLQQNPS